MISRAVTISLKTTRELILKDFASEPNEMKLIKAAHMMISNLAGQLALVQCREPLRSNLVPHIKQVID